MMQILARGILFLIGWKIIVRVNKEKIKRCVMIAAPHTSNWDLFFSTLTFWREKIAVQFFIKDTHTKSWYGFLIKAIGGIGVDRKKNNNLIEYAAKRLESNDELVILVPAEGTRKRVKEWKRGFYYIAKKAKVPVALGYLDYEKKEAGIGEIVHLTDNFDADMTRIENFYADKKGCYPERYNTQIFIRKNGE